MPTTPPSLLDYDRWRDANPEGDFSLFDYTYAVLRSKSLSADFLFSALRLCWPEFTTHDGYVLLLEQFTNSKLEELSAQGIPKSKLEFWCNLVSVDGLLLDVSDATAEHVSSIAEILRASWSLKLARDFPGTEFRVEVLTDEDGGDTCVTFFTAPVASTGSD